MRPSVLLLLDLRDYPDPPSDEAGSRRLWEQVEPDLIGRELRTDDTVVVRRPHGVISAVVLDTGPLPGGRTGPDTTFAVCGVLERPKLVYRCGPCGDAGRSRCRWTGTPSSRSRSSAPITRAGRGQVSAVWAGEEATDRRRPEDPPPGTR